MFRVNEEPPFLPPPNSSKKEERAHYHYNFHAIMHIHRINLVGVEDI